MYALAASAAGVGMLALTQFANAKVVYTPAHKQIAPDSWVRLDLNHDGHADFIFHDFMTVTSFGDFKSGRLNIYPASSRAGAPSGPANEIEGFANRSNDHYASVLSAGVRVGPNAPFSQYGKAMAWAVPNSGLGYHCGGPWAGARHRYLGLKFTANGKVHYGWARLNESCSVTDGENTALLTGYAYETIPNKPIITGQTKGSDDDVEENSGASLTHPVPDIPQPATLGALAIGAPGLPIWRREESVGGRTRKQLILTKPSLA
jgi:hypothetical protein